MQQRDRYSERRGMRKKVDYLEIFIILIVFKSFYDVVTWKGQKEFYIIHIKI